MIGRVGCNHEHWKRKKLEWIGKQLGVKKQEDWYSLRNKDVKSVGGMNFLQEHFNNSLRCAVQTIYSEFDWNPMFFRSVPVGHWNVKYNQRQLFDWIGEQLQIHVQEAWYLVTVGEVNNFGASGLLTTHYNSSLFLALQSIYPEFKWLPWRNQKGPANTWNNKETQRDFIERVGEQRQVWNCSEWLQIEGQDLLQDHRSLNSIYSELQPKHTTDGMLLRSEDLITKENQRTAAVDTWRRRKLDWIGEKLGIEEQLDWYSVRVESVKRFGGEGLLKAYNGSLFMCLRSIYPEFQWLPWLFPRIPQNLWNDQTQQRECMEWIRHQLQIHEISQWLKIPKSLVTEKKGQSLITFYGSFMKVLQSVYPEVNWNVAKVVSDGQKQTYNILQSILEDTEVLLDFRFYAKSGQQVELDVYIPSLSLALEYQGGQHYISTFYQGATLCQRQNNTQLKQAFCKERGITLLEVPYWWNNSIESLVASIHIHRPEIGKLLQNKIVTGVGEFKAFRYKDKQEMTM
jgi:hypothetical protein